MSTYLNYDINRKLSGFLVVLFFSFWTASAFGFQIDYYEGKWGFGNGSSGWYKLATFDLSGSSYNSVVIDAEVDYVRTYEYGFSAKASLFMRKTTTDAYVGKWNYQISGTEIGDYLLFKKIDATTYEVFGYSPGNYGHMSIRLAVTSEQNVVVTIPASKTLVSDPSIFSDVPKIGKSTFFMDNLGVGTASPDAKLTVKGDIHAEEVKVDLSVPGPDYVFKEGYDLKSLEEVQNYINEHGHLPNVPSAKEMEANGIQLGEMNMKLLEKIEELTLYMLEIKQEQRLLKQENKELKLQLQKLSKK